MFSAAVLRLLLIGSLAQGGERPRPPLLLTGAAVLDPSGAKLLAGRQVLIAHGRIVRVAADVGAVPAGAQRVDLTGLTIVPGLIDLHSHLLLHPYDEAPWDEQVLKENVGLRTARAVAGAKATLEAGFTTLRDLGTEGAGFVDVGIRDAIRRDIIPGPRLFVVTRAIVATGCYAPQGYDPRWELPVGAQEATGVDEVRRAVRQQIAAGADWVKVYADYHRTPDGPVTPSFSQAELSALVDEARSAGLPVAAHATTSEGIERAVMAGARTIEHGYSASAEALELMKRKGVVLCPTLAAAEAYERYAGWKPPTPDPPKLAEAKATFARALKIGVTIACGSDVGVFPHGENARELEIMASCGMAPADVLRAATATAAKVLGQENELGRIDEGAMADVIAVRGNPLEDVRALRKPVIVIRNGRIEYDGRERPEVHLRP
jgi:imidazolonepropionase-like amidohydrolase